MQRRGVLGAASLLAVLVTLGFAPARAQQEPIVPAFDIVRVEPDGSDLVAGKAEPNALVEMLIGEHAIGAGKADASGDFAIVLDQPLKPGDYQLTLRATTPDASAVASAETAVVSIPQTPGGQVLAMVEAPGKASEVITAPTPTTGRSSGSTACPPRSRAARGSRRSSSRSAFPPPSSRAASICVISRSSRSIRPPRAITTMRSTPSRRVCGWRSRT